MWSRPATCVAWFAVCELPAPSSSSYVSLLLTVECSFWSIQIYLKYTISVALIGNWDNGTRSELLVGSLIAWKNLVFQLLLHHCSVCFLTLFVAKSVRQEKRQIDWRIWFRCHVQSPPMLGTAIYQSQFILPIPILEVKKWSKKNLSAAQPLKCNILWYAHAYERQIRSNQPIDDCNMYERICSIIYIRKCISYTNP